MTELDISENTEDAVVSVQKKKRINYNLKPHQEKHAGKGRVFDPKRQEIFLNHYAETGLLHISAKAADVCVETIRNYRKNDPEFAENMELALALYREGIANEVYRRGVKGWDEPVYQKGELVGTIRRYSDRMLELQAKRHIPEYRDKMSVEATVKAGVMVVPATPATDLDWEEQFGDKARGHTGKGDDE